jgi:hypothetical protein
MTYKYILANIESLDVPGWTDCGDVDVPTVEAMTAQVRAARDGSSKPRSKTTLWQDAMETVEMNRSILDNVIARIDREGAHDEFGNRLSRSELAILLENRSLWAEQLKSVVELEKSLYDLIGLEIPAYLTAEEIFLD